MIKLQNGGYNFTPPLACPNDDSKNPNEADTGMKIANLMLGIFSVIVQIFGAYNVI
jgi:hypothetical protein